jgi:hypothetical protein
MISEFLKKAKAGEPVYINTVYDSFQSLSSEESQTLNCVLTLLENEEIRYFPIKIPRFQGNGEEDLFIKEYVWAELYNILSSLGGKKMDIYIEEKNTQLVHFAQELNNVFDIGKNRGDRRGYGRAVNVIDRMLGTLAPDSEGFQFYIDSLDKIPTLENGKKNLVRDVEVYHSVTKNLEGKILCGIDVGGTDIKIVLVKDGNIDS